MQMTERDLNVLISLSRYHFLTLDQLRRLHFPNRVKAQQRLKKMYDAGIIGRTIRPTIITSGKAEYVYFLKRKALDVMRDVSDEGYLVTIETAIPSRMPRTLNHILDINDVGISLEISTRNLNDGAATDTLTDTEIDTFNCIFIPEYLRIPEEESGHSKSYLSGRIGCNNGSSRFKSLTPDFMAVLNTSGKPPMLFFGEMDRGTESITTRKAIKYSFKHKVEAYISYFDRAGFQEFNNDFEADFQGFRVLIITTSEKRLQNILDCILEFNDVEFMWLTTLEQTKENILTSRIWRMASPMTRE